MPNKQVKHDKQEKPSVKIEVLEKAKTKVSDNLSIVEIDTLHYHYSKFSPLFKNAPYPHFWIRILERYIQIDNIVIGDVIINEIKQRGLDVSHTDAHVIVSVNELAMNNKKNIK